MVADVRRRCDVLIRRARRVVHASERGAILVFTAILLLVLVAFAALAVDLSNAWSNSQLSQTNADIAASGSLFKVPRTFISAPPAPLVQSEVQNEVDNLVSINVDAGVTAAATATVTFVADGADVAVDVTIDSENAFARAIGSGSQIPVDSTATAHLEIQPTGKLWPIGFYVPAFNGQSLADNVQPYQCRNVDAASGTATPRVCGGQGGFPDGGNGGRNRLLGMTRLGAFPEELHGQHREKLHHRRGPRRRHPRPRRAHRSERVCLWAFPHAPLGGRPGDAGSDEHGAR